MTEVILTGQHTHCCLRHSAYGTGAFPRGQAITVPADAVRILDGAGIEAGHPGQAAEAMGRHFDESVGAPLVRAGVA